MFVKICGITRLEDAQLAVQLGADAIGFVFWRQSARYIDPAAARDIVHQLPRRAMAVGVFVNESEEHVNTISRYAGLDAVQLHGDETADYCTRIERPVIRALAVGEQLDEEQLARVPSDALLLLDRFDRERRGGTGQSFDWSVAAAIARRRRTLLAGGLRPDTVVDAVTLVRPFGVDVSSGVERAPGIKDARKLDAFFDALGKSV